MNIDSQKEASAPGSVVALVRCEDYDASRVTSAVARGLTLLGGAERFANRGERILLKPNLLAGCAPEKAVTTHPSVFTAVTRQLLDAGAQLTYGDSPGFGRMETVGRNAGICQAAAALGVAPADFVKGKTCSFPDGNLVKQFTVAAGVFDADGIVSLPKLKTHALTRMTGAVKNQFGCIPGMRKAEFHARLPQLEQFARMLVDLTRLLKPRLYVMDAIVAMEGNGPRGGKPRQVSALLLSTDPVALDAAACAMMDLDPDLVPTIRWGEESGLGSARGVNIIGDALDTFVVAGYKANRDPAGARAALNGKLAWVLRRYVVSRPAIDAAQCTRCGTCVKVCPVTPKAVDFMRGKEHAPSHDYNACIRCYCCQEMCPDHAIDVRKTRLGKLLRF